MSETACEPNMMCDRNQDCFKGFLASWLTTISDIAPYTHDQIIPKIKASAEGAAKQCSGGKTGDQCGRRWYQAKWDGSTSMDSDMSALSVFSSTMISHRKEAGGPLTADTGGKSEGNPNAGSGSGKKSPTELAPITTGDRAGAGILTVLVVSGWAAAVGWMVYGG